MLVKLPTMDVVVPVYNEEAEIADCLQALLAQKNQLQKIIVVDNNSSDGTAAVVKKLAAENPQIVLLHEPKQGAENARSCGFNYSKADIIGRIDADTRVQAGWVKACREFLTTHQEFAGCSGMTIYYDLPARRLSDFLSWLSVFFANEVIGGNYSFYGANMAIRRQAWRKIRDTVKTEDTGQLIMEDLSISIALTQIGLKVGWAKDMLAHVSGRRIRTSPLEYYKYDARWWRTYSIYGRRWQAFLTRVFGCWPGNFCQCLFSVALRFHDPKTMKWSVKNWRRGFEGRDFQ
jgi:glycosyltransferase involved in cell wall biosynthesis